MYSLSSRSFMDYTAELFNITCCIFNILWFSVFFKSTYYLKETYLSKVNTPGSESILIRLKKDFFHLDRDIIVSFVYCVPAGSSYQLRTQFDPLEDFVQKTSSFEESCDLVCLRDFNSRTAQRPDFSVDDDNTDVPVLNRMFTPDTVAAFPRGNQDLLVNSYGIRLLEICQSVPLRILNGRKLGDVLGTYTCYKPKGQSVVDYCLVSPRMYGM